MKWQMTFAPFSVISAVARFTEPLPLSGLFVGAERCSRPHRDTVRKHRNTGCNFQRVVLPYLLFMFLIINLVRMDERGAGSSRLDVAPVSRAWQSESKINVSSSHFPWHTVNCSQVFFALRHDSFHENMFALTTLRVWRREAVCGAPGWPVPAHGARWVSG